jgi:hypothetical protein
VGIINLTEELATINVSSVPQQKVIGIEEEKMFDLDGDGFYDVAVKVESIAEHKANITINKVISNIEVVDEEEN